MDTTQTEQTSPRLLARVAGFLYLGCIISGLFDEVVRSSMVVRDDPAATAINILAAEPLYRATLVANFLGGAFYIGVTVILYGLLKPVSRTLSLTAAAFSLAGCAVGAAVLACLLAPMILLSGAPYLAVFTPDQLKALATVALKLHGQGYNVGLIFFGVYCALIGLLMFRSTFFPQWLGALMMAAGAGWLIDSLATILSPSFDHLIYPYIQALPAAGEFSLCVWLMVVGLDGPGWQRAHALAPA